MGGIRRDYSIGQEFQEVSGRPLSQVHRDVQEDGQKTDSRFCSFNGGVGADGGEVSCDG